MGEGFSNAIVGGVGKLIRAFIQSPNYLAGKTGWSINKDGSVDFNNGTFRSNVIVTDNNGVVVAIIDANGVKTLGTDGSTVQMATGGAAQLWLTPANAPGAAYTPGFVIALEDGTTEHRPYVRIGSPLANAPNTRADIFLNSGGITQQATSAVVQADTTKFISSAVNVNSGVLLVAGTNGRVSLYNGGVEETWHNAALLNAWVVSGSSNGMRYRKIASPANEVELRGVIGSPNPFNQIMFNLPAAYRPVANQSVWAWTGNGSGQLVQVRPNGDVVGFGSTTVTTDWWIAGTYPLD